MRATARTTWPYAVSVAWVAYFGMLQWSVVRFRVPIVAVLTLCTLALAWWQVRRPSPSALPPAAVAVALAGSALVTVVVPVFSYLPASAERATSWTLALAACAAATLLLLGRGGAALVACAAYLAAGTTAILADPRPRIDVWVLLQQASDALRRGENFYDMTWTGSPGIQDSFSYLPGTALLVAPGRWLGGDVRWALLLWGLIAAAGLITLGLARGFAPGLDRGSTPGRAAWTSATPAAAAVALVLLAPGTLTQLDQAWTEPLLFAGLVWWAVLVQRSHAWWAVVPLALACASKQHLALLLPVLLLWRPFGVARTLATGGLAAVVVAPWLVASPPDFLHDTVSLLITFHPIRFANTLYLLALNEFGVTLPFWVTGFVVLSTLAAVVWVVRRRQPQLPELLRWLALVLLVANLVNKQAFYNQFWLVGALVAASFAAAPVAWPGRSAPAGDAGAGHSSSAGWVTGSGLRGPAGRPPDVDEDPDVGAAPATARPPA